MYSQTVKGDYYTEVLTFNYQSSDAYYLFTFPAMNKTVKKYRSDFSNSTVELYGSDFGVTSSVPLNIYAEYFPLGNNGLYLGVLPNNTYLNFVFNFYVQQIANGVLSDKSYTLYLSLDAYDVNGNLMQTITAENTVNMQASSSNYGVCSFNLQYTFKNQTAIAYLVPRVYTTLISVPGQQVGLSFWSGSNWNLIYDIPIAVRDNQAQLLWLLKIFNNGTETNEWLERILNAIEGGSGGGEADDKRDEADELIEDMDSLEKPSAGEAADSADPFDIVTESQFKSFTDVLQSILNQEIIRNMLLLSIIVVLISYVLFGKK